jgi:long-chain acyl-CoA synthetase
MAGDNGASRDARYLVAIARFKRPKCCVCLETLPKNNYGKVLKTK